MRLMRHMAFVVHALLVFSLALGSGPRAAAQVAGDTVSLSDLSDDPFLRDALYVVPERLASGDAPSGAVSVNAAWERGERDTWFIEQQRYGADFVQAGLVTGDDATVERGWRILLWGFAHQGPEGDFPGTGDPYHSTSFFVEAAARALLLMRAHDADRYRERVNDTAPWVLAAARWMTRSDVAMRGANNNRPYTHRRYLVAAALGETALLTGDPTLAQAAATSARDGLTLQRPDGVNPERDGGDVNYQAVGALFAARYRTTTPDVALRDDLAAMIARALAWEAARVDAAGNVDADDSTRTGMEAGRNGATKTIDYKTITQAFISGDRIVGGDFRAAATRIAVGRGWVGQ